MMTNKLTKAFMMAFLMASGLVLTSMLMTGCKSSTEPTSQQTYDSEAAADLTATALGNQSGGLGVALGDSYNLASQGFIPRSGIVEKGGQILGVDSTYDPSTGWHTISLNVSATGSNFDITKTYLYRYQMLDSTGAFVAKWKRGVVDTIHVQLAVTKNRTLGTRVSMNDTAGGAWTMSGLAHFADNPMFNGYYTRGGADTLFTPSNKNRSLVHSMTINFANDTLVRLVQGKDRYFFFAGTATSDLSATTGKGVSFTRHTDITFNGDGTATLVITRTSGDGTTDTVTVDVVVGIFRKWGRP